MTQCDNVHMPKIAGGITHHHSHLWSPLVGQRLDIPLPKFGFGKKSSKSPKADVQVDASKDTKHGFGFDWPQFGSGKESPKANVNVDLDVDMKHRGDVGFVDVAMPQLDISGDIDGKAEISGDVGTGKIAVDKPDADFGADVNVTGPSIDGGSLKVKGEGGGKFDIPLPKFGFGKKSQKSPKADVQVDASKDTKHGFGFDWPKFGFAGSVKAKGKVDDDVEAGVDIDVGVRKGEVSDDVTVAGPQIDVNFDKPDVNTKAGSKFKSPSFGFGARAPDAKVGTDTDASAKDVGRGAAGLEGRVDVDLPKGELGAGGDANLDIDRPQAELEGDVNVGSPDLKVDVHKPEFGGKGQGKFKIKGPKFGFGAKADVHVPDADANLDIDKKHMEKGGVIRLYMPKFGFGGSGKADVDAGLPSGKLDADVSVEQPSPPHVKGEVKLEGPHVDSNLDKPKGKQKGKVNLPKFGSKGKADVRAELPAGEVGADVSVVVQPHTVADMQQKMKNKFLGE